MVVTQIIECDCGKEHEVNINNPYMGKKPYSFELDFCPSCGKMFNCPVCGNNCCSPCYGHLDGDYTDESTKCPFCELTFQYQDLFSLVTQLAFLNDTEWLKWDNDRTKLSKEEIINKAMKNLKNIGSLHGKN